MPNLRTLNAILMTSVLFSACGGDSTGPEDDPLVGTWIITSVVEDAVAQVIDDVVVAGRWEIFPDRLRIYFKWYGELDPGYNFDWKTEGNQLYTRMPGELEWDEPLTFSVTKSILVITFEWEDEGHHVQTSTYSRSNP